MCRYALFSLARSQMMLQLSITVYIQCDGDDIIIKYITIIKIII